MGGQERFLVFTTRVVNLNASKSLCMTVLLQVERHAAFFAAFSVATDRVGEVAKMRLTTCHRNQRCRDAFL